MTAHDKMESARAARTARAQVPRQPSSGRGTKVATALQRYLAGELAIAQRRAPEHRTKDTKD